MKKIFCPVLLLCYAPLTANAHPSLETIEQTYRSTQTLQAEFTQSTFVPLLDKTVIRPGRIFYEKGGKLRIEYAGETMTHYISDGESLWTLEPKTKNIQAFRLADAGLPAEALRFLTELGELRKYFDVQTGKTEKIVLTPKNKSTYRFLECRFGDNHYLKTLTIHTLAGNTSTYRFFNIQANAELPPKLFRP